MRLTGISRLTRVTLGLALGAISACAEAGPALDEAGAAKDIYGWVERVQVLEIGEPDADIGNRIRFARERFGAVS